MKKALLIFAKQPVPGKVKTRLSPPFTPADAAALYRCMLADTLESVASVRDARQFLFFEPSPGAADYFRKTLPGVALFPQEGNDLGERLENAFGRLFAMGFDTVAAIGTDSPDLPPSYAEQAFRLLETEQADVVFGPAADGGYYLVALRRLQPELFRDIPWSTGETLQMSEAAARTLGLAVELLPVWHDMDTVEDLERFLEGGESGRAIRTRQLLTEIAGAYQ